MFSPGSKGSAANEQAAMDRMNDPTQQRVHTLYQFAIACMLCMCRQGAVCGCAVKQAARKVDSHPGVPPLSTACALRSLGGCRRARLDNGNCFVWTHAVPERVRGWLLMTQQAAAGESAPVTGFADGVSTRRCFVEAARVGDTILACRRHLQSGVDASPFSRPSQVASPELITHTCA